MEAVPTSKPQDPAADPSRSWSEALFRAIDRRDPERFLGFLADDAEFRFANLSPARGRDAIRDAVAGFFGSIAAVRHEVADVWSVPGHVVCRGTVTYTRLDGREVSMAFCNALGLRGELVVDYRIYIDPAPLFAP